nr:hypothetical protein [Tetrasphaera sp. HKS02]
MRPASHRRGRAQQPEAGGVLDEILQHDAEALDVVDAVEHEQDILPVEGALEGQVRCVAGRHLGPQGSEAGGEQRVGGRVTVGDHPGRAAGACCDMAGDQRLAAAGRARQGHPPAAARQVEEPFEELLATHAGSQHPNRLSTAPGRYRWFHRCGGSAAASPWRRTDRDSGAGGVEGHLPERWI